MSVKEYAGPSGGGMIPSDVAFAHEPINIAQVYDREYLNSLVANQSGDATLSWTNYRRIGEVRYAIQRSARIAGSARLVAAKVNEKGQIVETKDRGVEADIVSMITSRFGGTRGLIERYYTLMNVPGQSFFTKVRENRDGTGNLDGYWFLSASEIAKEGDPERRAKAKASLTWTMRRAAGANSIVSTRSISPEDFLGRVWAPDHQFVEDVNSPMEAINPLCEQLHTLNETLAGRLRQRFALAGILLIPNEISDAAISADEKARPRDGLYSSDKVMNYLIHVMTTNVINHAKGLASIPILLKGPAAVLDKVRHMVMDVKIFEEDLKHRAVLIESIFTSLNQQKQSVTGGEDTSHWGQWAIADEERRITVQPELDSGCHALTRLVLWPELQARGRKAGSILPWRVWYDLSAAQVRSNQGEDARQGFDRMVVSGTWLRNLMGATDEDAPSDAEYVRQLGVLIKNPILATYGLEGVDVDWDRAAAWGKSPGPTADSPGDDPQVGPGVGDPGSPDDRDSDTPRSEEPG